MLDREPPALGRLEVEVAQAQGAGQGDVLRLADVEALASSAGRAPPCPAAADRRQVLLARLRIDDVPLDVVQRHRVGREEDRVVLPGPLAALRAERPALDRRRGCRP